MTVIEDDKKARRTALIKAVVLGVLGTGIALAVSYALARAADAFSLRLAIMGGIAILAWLTAVTIQCMAFPQIRFAVPCFLIQVVALFAFITEGASVSFLAAGGVLFVFLVIGFFRARGTLNNALKIRFFRTAILAIGPATTGLAVFLTVYAVNLLNLSTVVVPPRLMRVTLQGAAPFVARFVPNFSATIPMDNFLRFLVSSNVPPGAANREAILAALAADFEGRLERLTRTPIEPNDRVLDFALRAVNGTLRRLAEESPTPLLIGIGVLLFLAVKGVAFFVNWGVAFFAFIAYQVLLVFGFLYVGFESRNKEVLLIK